MLSGEDLHFITGSKRKVWDKIIKNGEASEYSGDEIDAAYGSENLFSVSHFNSAIFLSSLWINPTIASRYIESALNNKKFVSWLHIKVNQHIIADTSSSDFKPKWPLYQIGKKMEEAGDAPLYSHHIFMDSESGRAFSVGRRGGTPNYYIFTENEDMRDAYELIRSLKEEYPTSYFPYFSENR